MRKLSLRRQSPGLVVGCIALVVALGGTAFALPGKETVDKGDYKPDSVGAAALKGVQVRNANVSVADGQYGEAKATCRPNQQLLGGGADWDNTALATFTPLMDSGPSGNGWYARGFNGSGTGSHTLNVNALCLKK